MPPAACSRWCGGSSRRRAAAGGGSACGSGSTPARWSPGCRRTCRYTVIGDAVNTAARLSDAAGVGAVYAGRDTALTTAVLGVLAGAGAAAAQGQARAGHGVRAGGAATGRRDPARARRRGAVPRPRRGVRPAGRAAARRRRRGSSRTPCSSAATRGSARPGWRRRWPASPASCPGRGCCGAAARRTARGATSPRSPTWCAPPAASSTSDDVETARARVARTVARLDDPTGTGPVPAVVAERLQALLGLEEDAPPGLSDGATPGAPVGGDRVRQAVAALFSALAREAPLLLVLDDLHWATPDDARGRARRRGPGARPGAAARRRPAGHARAARERPVVAGAAVGRGAARCSPLRGAAPPSGCCGPTSACPRARLDRPVRDAAARRAQGNPFFLAELLHLLVDRGVLRREGDRWVLAGTPGAAPSELLPAGVQAVLAARIDGLDGAGQGGPARRQRARAGRRPAGRSRRSGARPATATRRWCATP